MSCLPRALCPLLAAALLLTTGLAGPSSARGQKPASGDQHPYGTGLGLEIQLTNSGFGFGSYYRQAASHDVSLLVETSVGAGKHESEAAFYSGYGRVIFNKANYLLMAPIHTGIHKRLFQSQIEDNFRPYLQFSAGPTLGYEYPYFDDLNGNGEYDAVDDEPRYDAFGGLLKGAFRFGLGGMVAFGAHFGRSQRSSRGIRIGYRLDYFPSGIQLLEPASNPEQHYFGSPTISLLFGRLF